MTEALSGERHAGTLLQGRITSPFRPLLIRHRQFPRSGSPEKRATSGTDFRGVIHFSTRPEIRDIPRHALTRNATAGTNEVVAETDLKQPANEPHRTP